MKTRAYENVLILGVIVVAAAFLYDVFLERELEDKSIEELTELMNDYIKRDTTESYRCAAKIRDIINLKSKTL